MPVAIRLTAPMQIEEGLGYNRITTSTSVLTFSKEGIFVESHPSKPAPDAEFTEHSASDPMPPKPTASIATQKKGRKAKNANKS